VYLILAANVSQHIEYGLAVLDLHGSYRQNAATGRDYSRPFSLKVHAVVYSGVAADRYGDSLLGSRAGVSAAVVIIAVSVAALAGLTGLCTLLGLSSGAVLSSALTSALSAGTAVLSALVLIAGGPGVSALRPGLPLAALRRLLLRLALVALTIVSSRIAVVAVLSALAGLASLRGLPSLLSLAAGRALLIIRRTAFVFLFPEAESFVYPGLKPRLLFLLLLRIVSALVVQVQLAAVLSSCSSAAGTKAKRKNQNQYHTQRSFCFDAHFFHPFNLGLVIRKKQKW
jgi:hypothetical protein